MEDLSVGKTDPRLFSPAALAFIGDGVFELMVREKLLSGGPVPVNTLHKLAVKKVNAAAQSKAYGAIEKVLSDAETGILKRGRNAHSATVPKNCSVADYRRATAVEALFGYLYLSGETARLHELFAVIEANSSVSGEK